MDDSSPPPKTPEQAAHLAARFLPTLRNPQEPLVRWVGGGEEPDGTLRLSHPQLHTCLEALFDALVEESWVFPFDWGRWLDVTGHGLLETPGGLERASLEELRRLFTVFLRQERFGPGVLAQMAEQGVIRRMLERMEQLGCEHG